MSAMQKTRFMHVLVLLTFAILTKSYVYYYTCLCIMDLSYSWGVP